MTPEQIGDLLGLSGDEVAAFKNPWTEVGIVYRHVLAEKTLELHEKTLKLAEENTKEVEKDLSLAGHFAIVSSDNMTAKEAIDNRKRESG